MGDASQIAMSAAWKTQFREAVAGFVTDAEPSAPGAADPLGPRDAGEARPSFPSAERPLGPSAQRPSGPSAAYPLGPSAAPPSGPSAVRPLGPSAARPSGLGAGQVHLLVPAQRWDWEATLIGQTPTAQIELCDTMPASCATGSDYSASSDSFSDAYATFLELLSGFSPASRLAEARAALVKPPSEPASMPNPSGWTKTLDGAGMLRWALDWVLTTTPARWVLQHGGGDLTSSTLAAPAMLRLLEGEPGATPATAPTPRSPDAGASNVVAIPTTPGKPLSVSGAGWSRVPVYPGSWYASSVVALGRDGPFEGGRTAERVIGPTGILRCRVAELIVAEQVSISASLASTLTARELAAADAVQLGPVAADPADASLKGSTLTVTTPAGLPYLVGVIYAQP